MNRPLSNEFQKLMMNEAKKRRVPLSVNMELLPVCNLDCKMCYIRSTMEQVQEKGGLRSKEEWLELAQEMRKGDTLFLLLTGGEVFLYPQFKELYIELYKMGFIITINTNATLIDESIVEWLKDYPPMCVSISLYGASDETYEKLCGRKGMFTKVNRAAHLLDANGIRIEFKTIFTPSNVHDLENCWKFTGCGGVHYETATYAFPPVRKVCWNEQQRLNPTEAVDHMFSIEHLMSKDEEEYRRNVLDYLQKYESTRHLMGRDLYGFTCGAANNSCWITWQGHMTPCAMLEEPYVLPFESGFYQAWEELKRKVDRLLMAPKCSHCDKRGICSVCPAACYAETGSLQAHSPYHCRMTEYMLERMQAQVNEWELAGRVIKENEES